MKNDKTPFFKKTSFYISIVVFIFVCLLLIELVVLNILPMKYFGLLAAFSLLLTIFTIFFLNLKRKNILVSVISYMLAATLIFVSCLGVYVVNTTEKTLERITMQATETTHYVKAYAVNDLTEKVVDDMQNQTVGILKNQARDKVDACIKDMNEKGITFEIKEYESSIELINNLKGRIINFIILDESYLTTIEDYNGFENISDDLLELYAYGYTVEKKDSSMNEVDVTNSPFIVLISGSDSRIGIEETARSDVNMVVQVNPNTNMLLMISIPRDYYVEFDCDKSLGCAVGKVDKLTHTGLHGIGTTQATIEKLLDVKINYNATVTFNTVTQLVDALNGITIGNSQEVILEGFTYDVGNIHVNGEQALRYARERYSYASGDRQRGKNQMTVVKGILDKMLSPQLLKNFKGIMDAISGTFTTNMPVKSMTKLVNKQLEENKPWKIYQYSLDGSNGTDYAYELGDYASVMYPNEETIQHAKMDIQAMNNGEIPPYKNK